MEICLGGRSTHLMLCLANILLSQLYDVWSYGNKAIEVGFSFGCTLHQCFSTAGPREFLLDFVILVFKAIFMSKCFKVEIL